MVLYLGLVKVSAVRDLWKTERVFSFSFPHSVMPGYRFESISANLHMNDPDTTAKNDQLRGQPGHDQLCRLRPVLGDIIDACRAYYHPHQNFAVDERMVKTKARIRMKQLMKNKPTKWGYKLFVLADSKNGYTCDFTIYEGKAKSPSSKGLSFDAVVDLLNVHYLGTGYHIYVDNFYTSTMLFSHLHNQKFGACGTVRERRLGFPRTNVNALPEHAQRGDMRWIREGPLLYVKWQDTRGVTMCSTIHKAYDGGTAQRNTHIDGAWARETIPVPTAIKQYNKYMGGVDLSDALIKFYTVDRKTSRWYMKLFFHLIDIAVVNSFILQKEMAEAKRETPLTQKRFRIQLIEALGRWRHPHPRRQLLGPLSPCRRCQTRTACLCQSASCPLIPPRKPQWGGGNVCTANAAPFTSARNVMCHSALLQTAYVLHCGTRTRTVLAS